MEEVRKREDQGGFSVLVPVSTGIMDIIYQVGKYRWRSFR